MFEFLDKVITFIQNMYNDINEEWLKQSEYENINYKKTLVKDINQNNDLLVNILNYRDFVNDMNMVLLWEFGKFFSNNAISARVKSQNSIEYKLENYVKNHNNGEVPINKCFNDIYGIRIICEDEIKFDEVKNFIDIKYTNLKCIDSSKKEYIATHIYFKKDNFSFPWELQIWDRKHEKSNITSHDKYKQEYKKWENENKGGSNFGDTLYNNE